MYLYVCMNKPTSLERRACFFRNPCVCKTFLFCFINIKPLKFVFFCSLPFLANEYLPFVFNFRNISCWSYNNFVDPNFCLRSVHSTYFVLLSIFVHFFFKKHVHVFLCRSEREFGYSLCWCSACISTLKIGHLSTKITLIFCCCCCIFIDFIFFFISNISLLIFCPRPSLFDTNDLRFHRAKHD